MHTPWGYAYPRLGTPELEQHIQTTSATTQATTQQQLEEQRSKKLSQEMKILLLGEQNWDGEYSEGYAPMRWQKYNRSNVIQFYRKMAEEVPGSHLKEKES